MKEDKIERLAKEIAKGEMHLEYERNGGAVDFFASFDCEESNISTVKELVDALEKRVKDDIAAIKSSVKGADSESYVPKFSRNFSGKNNPRWYCKGFATVFKDVNTVGSLDAIVDVLEKRGYTEF